MNDKRKEAPPTSLKFELAGRSNFLRIDLDAILHNVRILRSKCSSHTEVMAVIKANAYGHGSVVVARHLHTHGVHHFAVATAYEGQELRQAGVMGFIQVLGNCVVEEAAVLRQHQLTPTVSTEAFVRQWAAWPGHSSQLPCPSVVIKVDSDPSEATVKVIQDAGLRPALSWIAQPNMVKLLPPGRRVGYDQTYELDEEETIATFSIGYADGYSRQLSGKGVVTTMNGEERPVVGRVSMDAITVTVRPSTTVDTPFYIYSDDPTSANSVAGVARALGTIPYEVGTRLAIRLPRLYVTANCVFIADGKVTTTTATLSQCEWDGQGTSNGAGSERTS